MSVQYVLGPMPVTPPALSFNLLSNPMRKVLLISYHEEPQH